MYSNIKFIVVVATTKVGIFKQITTAYCQHIRLIGCCCYHKGRNFQANHNRLVIFICFRIVVVATTKVGIFKQITTPKTLAKKKISCCCYHKGRNFQANHNAAADSTKMVVVVVATTKVGIFKQITTLQKLTNKDNMLLLLPQR
ncbi:hypothetical protein [Prevotella multiformis]|uniref:hypothetical protein n=1 Tax=Prevotella multiformis TaxID=282402 RepID=UPI0028DB2707|nr:hypothetical protein [Prevotella multiformis]